ncbi:MAG: AAA family ATPase, partial [Bdellovibrionales bacterium]|nr:AAA family ATPase [Bdellovibrionales bacterium]
MRVSRLEIFGFKSFMDRLVLPLDGGVTGIVGPNGCGKSNIVDALRWVLGETKAKNLRGGHLEDVIFNGTDKLRPLGLAEVTLSLRASGDNFFSDLVSPDLEAEILVQEVQAEAETDLEDEEVVVDGEEAPVEGAGKPHLTVIDGRKNQAQEAENQPNGEDVLLGDVQEATQQLETSKEETTADEEDEVDDGTPLISATLLSRFSWLRSASEVQVTRRLYRSGESEFFINRVPCRLKDLKEFFRAVGVSARAYTIVAQGEVARIVTSKPVERRLILEEAAGVLGFRDKIRSAERRLKETEVNISRIEDIHKEVTRQVNALRRQAAKARNREQLKAEIREHELALFRDDLLRFRSSSLSVKEALVQAREEEELIRIKLAESNALEESACSELMS